MQSSIRVAGTLLASIASMMPPTISGMAVSGHTPPVAWQTCGIRCVPPSPPSPSASAHVHTSSVSISVYSTKPLKPARSGGTQMRATTMMMTRTRIERLPKVPPSPSPRRHRLPRTTKAVRESANVSIARSGARTTSLMRMIIYHSRTNSPTAWTKRTARWSASSTTLNKA